MNYQKIYDDLVKRGHTRVLKGYQERHHILPKCIGGADNPSNLVYLTAREHFICHWLLHRIHPENSKITYAFWMMCLAINKQVQPRYRPSSRVYEEARVSVIALRKGQQKTRETIQKRTESRKGFKHSEDSKEQMSAAHRGRKVSEETKQKMREAHKGKKKSPHTEEAKQKMRGKKLTDEHKQKLSEARKKSWETRKRSLLS